MIRQMNALKLLTVLMRWLQQSFGICSLAHAVGSQDAASWRAEWRTTYGVCLLLCDAAGFPRSGEHGYERRLASGKEICAVCKKAAPLAKFARDGSAPRRMAGAAPISQMVCDSSFMRILPPRGAG